MAEQRGNQTPNTPDVSETELREMKVDELRQEAKDAGVGSTSGMRKEELVDAVAQARSGESEAGTGGDGESDEAVGAGPDGGRIRKGPEMSDSLKYSQEVTSPDEEPEREGRSLVTTSHEVIKAWAEERDATPATVEGTEHGDHLGVLRFDFGGGDDKNLRQVSWDEWFNTFDVRRLNFIYQEQRSDGRQSNFFQFDNPEREDA
jgi:Rho termination factor, N-terminal domain